MSVGENHLVALRNAAEQTADSAERKLLRECLYELSGTVSRRVAEHATAALRSATEPMVETDDLQLIDRLVAMGVQQNGLVPTLSALEVGRALGVLGSLLGRAHVGHLEHEEITLLEAVFDHAAEHDEVTKQVRELELRIRGSLGLDQRIAWPQQELPLS
jgi:hypothetical protein